MWYTKVLASSPNKFCDIAFLTLVKFESGVKFFNYQTPAPHNWYRDIIWHYSYVILGSIAFKKNQPHDCLLKRLFRRRSKKTSKLPATGLCAGNSPDTGEFSAQRASNAENVSIWWRHHVSSTNQGNNTTDSSSWAHDIPIQKLKCSNKRIITPMPF